MRSSPLRRRGRPTLRGGGLALVGALGLGAGLLATPPANAATGCEVDYTIANDWGSGFTANVTVTNLGDPVDSWTVEWDFPGDQQVTNGWQGSFSQSGSHVTVESPSWGGSIGTDGTASFGFNGSYSGSNAVPESFTLNGTTCDGSTGGGDNQAPSVSLTSPQSGASYTAPATVELAADASDSDGSVSEVAFYAGSTQIGTDSSSPYTATWENASAGDYSLTAEATDDSGATTTSESVSVTVEGDGGNGGGGTHVDNPYVGATSYINPDYTALANESASQVSNEQLASKMEQVGQQPTAVWMDRIAAISGDRDRMGLREHLNTALEQKQSGQPIVFEGVIYDLPGRDCHAAASNGELPPTQEGFNRYKSEYIDPIVDILNDEKYSDIRMVLTIEPDSLPNLITNAGGSGDGRTSDEDCIEVQEEGWYVNGIQYALSQFDDLSNVYSYVDIGHSAWLGWDNNLGPAVDLFTEVAQGVPNGGMDSVDGFITNTANYTPIEEPFLTDSSLSVGGSPIRSATFYEWNPIFDERDYANALHDEFVSSGWPESLGMLIDTGRNGWGGDYRPTELDESPTTTDGYVDANRIDQRPHRGLWCNQKQAGIGERPQVNPYGSSSPIEAFVWVKPPGESDGASSEEAGTPERKYDPNCDPDNNYEGMDVNTNSLPGAPGAGLWFHDQFKMLVQNAYPEIQP